MQFILFFFLSPFLRTESRRVKCVWKKFEAHTQGRNMITHKCSILPSFCCSGTVTLWPGGFVKVSEDFPGSRWKPPKLSNRSTTISRNVQCRSFKRAQSLLSRINDHEDNNHSVFAVHDYPRRSVFIQNIPHSLYTVFYCFWKPLSKLNMYWPARVLTCSFDVGSTSGGVFKLINYRFYDRKVGFGS